MQNNKKKAFRKCDYTCKVLLSTLKLLSCVFSSDDTLTITAMSTYRSYWFVNCGGDAI